MIETIVPKNKELKSVFPSQSELRERLSNRFPYTSHLTQSIFQCCVEEMEKILCDVTAGEEMTEMEIKAVIGKRHNYSCKRCKKQRISRNHSYCNNCGQQIKWI